MENQVETENRVEKIALQVLKENSHHIFVPRTGPHAGSEFVMKIKGVQYGTTKSDEIFSALKTLSYFCTVKTEDVHDITVSSEIDVPSAFLDGSLANHPVGALARKLADNEVNFSGSERFRSRQIA